MDMTRLRLGQAGAGRFCATGAWIVVLASVANGTPKLWRWRFNFAAGRASGVELLPAVSPAKRRAALRKGRARANGPPSSAHIETK
jgi:hypothetical protein